MVAIANKIQPRSIQQPQAVTNVDQESKRQEKKLDPQLHAKPEKLAEDYGFKKLRADDTDDKKLKALLNRFDINGKATEYDNAVLSQDGKTLVIANRGEVGLRELFGGTNTLSRTLYKAYGWLARALGFAHRSIAAAKYQELFNAADIEMQHEPLKHLLQTLKSGEYHSLSIFYKDDQTGEFAKDPDAAMIIDAYENVIEANLTRRMKNRGAKAAEIKAEVEKSQNEFKDCYSIDKMIHLKEGLQVRKLLHQSAEALYQAQGFKMLTAPSQMHEATNANSEHLNFQEINYHSAGQDTNGKFFVTGEAKLVDELDGISAEDKLAYLQHLKPSSYPMHLTVVRPIAEALKPIDPYLGYVHQWSLISKGSGLRTTSKADLDIVELSEPINAAIIEAHNLKLAPK